jgi:hypothetical protein
MKSTREERLLAAVRGAIRLRRAIINPLAGVGYEAPNYQVPRQAVLEFDNLLKGLENESKDAT